LILRVRVNGEDREVRDGITVGALLTELGLRRDGIAVAINLQVVPRGEHDQRVLIEGDKIEVLQAVGGG
jgi:sulfur carrier protein